MPEADLESAHEKFGYLYRKSLKHDRIGPSYSCVWND